MSVVAGFVAELGVRVRRLWVQAGVIVVTLVLSLAVFPGTAFAAPPETVIDSSPTNPSLDTTPTFTFLSNDGAATFECSLDDGAYVPCTSPYTAPVLTLGAHSFAVRATNLSAETDLTPAAYSWDITAFDDGDGSPGDPYQISECVQLQAMHLGLSDSYILVDSVNCDGYNFTPVGESGDEFTGTLDGDGFWIQDLTITAGSDVGLFGVTSGATIENLKIIGSSISGVSQVGALAGNAGLTTITDVRVVATDVNGTGSIIGGVVGQLGGSTLERVSFDNGTVTGDDHAIGGLVGYMVGPSSIGDSFSSGLITDFSNSGNDYVGGLVGQSAAGPGIIGTSYSTMEFTDLTTTNGGLVGFLHANTTVLDSFFAGVMTSGGGSNIGAAFGTVNGAASNIKFDRTKSGQANCAGTGSPSCTAVNVANAAPNYFYDTASSSPLDQWDFGPGDPWHVNYNDYPSLTPIYGPEMLCEEATRTLTTIHAACDYQDHGWGTTTWEVQYQEADAASWIPLTLENIHVGEVTITGVSPTTEYNVRFRYTNDSGTSPWGIVMLVLADTDGDGTNDLIEGLAPNDGDANDDGTPDAQQAHVTSYFNGVSDDFATLEVSDDCSIESVGSTAESANSAQDAGYRYPAGLMRFTLDCGTPGFTATVRQLYHNLDFSHFEFRKYDSRTHTYQLVQGAAIQATENSSLSYVQVEYEITDGGALDEDGAANGTIVDPTGLALGISVPNTGLGRQSSGVLAMLVALGTSSAVINFWLRRRYKLARPVVSATEVKG